MIPVDFFVSEVAQMLSAFSPRRRTATLLAGQSHIFISRRALAPVSYWSIAGTGALARRLMKGAKRLIVERTWRCPVSTPCEFGSTHRATLEARTQRAVNALAAVTVTQMVINCKLESFPVFFG